MQKPTASDSSQLFRQAAQRRPAAQRELYQRYADRLIALVRARIAAHVRARFDAEDVVNSAFASFFQGLEADRFVLPSHGGLWPLLAKITIHKLHRQVAHHQSEKRNVATETNALQNPEIEASSRSDLAQSDLAQASAIVQDELDWLAQRLPPRALRAIEFSIEGYSHSEIASELNLTNRTVRRYLAEARALLRSRIESYSPSKVDAGDATAQAANQLSLDDYVLRRMIGEGRFAKVYLATQIASGDDVVIKFLRKRWASDSRVVNQFDRESQILQRCKVPGVVALIGSGHVVDPNSDAVADGRFIVMNWIDAKPLADNWPPTLIDSAVVSSAAVTSPTDHKRTVRQFADLATTLREVHQAGIVHRDLKPANVLVTNQQKWLLTDFGLATDFGSSLGSTSEIFGTPAYMAPEQIDPFFGPIGPWTDLYAFGVMMLEVLTGRLRYTDANPSRVMQATMATSTNDVTTALQQIRIADETIRLVVGLLQPKTRDRFQTADDVLKRL